MKLWAALYTMIWIVLIEFLLAMTPGGSPVLIYLHVVLGAAIVGLAFYNFSGLRKTRVPGRVKRIGVFQHFHTGGYLRGSSLL
ncbi:MAG: hypothetical protein KKI06_01200 [Euryarchaeota archaeon]|nr:hypothetical protein [Euryarchaeota archaeon]